MSFPLVLPVDQLDQHLGSLKSQGKTASEAGICLVDLRSAEAYAAGHIPFAVNADPQLLNRSAPPIGGLLPGADAVEQFLGSIGARPGDQIIAYDGGHETSAARLIWVMDAYGYEACSWLNGGFKAWQASQLPISTEPFTASQGNLSLTLIGDNVIDIDQLVPELDNPQIRILDVRSSGEYQGTDVRATFGGHVPGAQHMEWTKMLDHNGRLLEDAKLEQILDALNTSHNDTVIVYCQTHQRSAVTYVALKHLGFTDVRAIDGAWSAWGSRADTPKQTPGVSQ